MLTIKLHLVSYLINKNIQLDIGSSLNFKTTPKIFTLSFGYSHRFNLNSKNDYYQKVDSKNELLKFIKFPFKLYKNSKFWVPPIVDQEIENFDKEKNQNIKQSKTDLFLAYKKSKVVGRIVAIINNYEVEVTNIKKIRFGWFDFIDDYEVSKKLLDKIDRLVEKIAWSLWKDRWDLQIWIKWVF